MLMSEFGEKLLLSVIDKVALGGVVLVFGFFINRHLEGIKSREAVRKALLERRMTAILEQWDALRNFHFDIVDAWFEGAPAAAGESALPAPVEESPPLSGAGEGRGLPERGSLLTREIRSRRGFLGKPIADAMYAALNVDQNSAWTLSSGDVPPTDPPRSPDFEWLEHILDAPDMEDLPCAMHEEKLAASRSTFLREWKEKQKKMDTRSVAARASAR